MKRHQPEFVYGYHGCDESVAKRILESGDPMSPSYNAYDWLGSGIYFWEDAPERALQWAVEMKKPTNTVKEKSSATRTRRVRKPQLDENGEEKSCHRNHRRFTLCAYHHDNHHKGDWKTCPLCRKMAEPEMVAWYGTNEYNWEKMPDPPKFKPTKCHKCGKSNKNQTDLRNRKKSNK